MDEDLALLQTYERDRSAEAFAALTGRYGGLVYAAALRVTGNAHDAEEVAQECFLALARQPCAVRSSVPGWLHSAAVSRSRDLLRANQRRRNYEQARPAPAGPDATWAEIAPHLDEAILELPDDLRETVVGHFLQGRTQAELAARWAIHQSNVSRRIDKALEGLRERLRKKGIVVALAILAGLLATRGAEAMPMALLTSLTGSAGGGGAAGASVAPTAGFPAKVFVAAAAGVVIAVGLTAIGFTTWRNNAGRPRISELPVTTTTEAPFPRAAGALPAGPWPPERPAAGRPEPIPPEPAALPPPPELEAPPAAQIEPELLHDRAAEALRWLEEYRDGPAMTLLGILTMPQLYAGADALPEPEEGPAPRAAAAPVPRPRPAPVYARAWWNEAWQTWRQAVDEGDETGLTRDYRTDWAEAGRLARQAADSAKRERWGDAFTLIRRATEKARSIRADALTKKNTGKAREIEGQLRQAVKQGEKTRAIFLWSSLEATAPAYQGLDDWADALERLPGVRDPLTIELEGGPAGFVRIGFLRIAPGTFVMGESRGHVYGVRESRSRIIWEGLYESPPHAVVVEYPYLMARHETTQAQWLALVDRLPIDKPLHPEYPALPVHCHMEPFASKRAPTCPAWGVNWFWAQEYVYRLRSAHPGIIFALPTEKQWERGCRAGSSSLFYWGEDVSLLRKRVRVPSGYAEPYSKKEVGGYPPNPWGLFDMYGNIAEWCRDRFQGYPGSKYPPVTDALGCLRGNAMQYSLPSDPGRYCFTSAARFLASKTSDENYGFRLAVNLFDTDAPMDQQEAEIMKLTYGGRATGTVENQRGTRR